MYSCELTPGLRQARSPGLAAWAEKQAGGQPCVVPFFSRTSPKLPHNTAHLFPLLQLSTGLFMATDEEDGSPLAPAAKKPLREQSGLPTFGLKSRH